MNGSRIRATVPAAMTLVQSGPRQQRSLSLPLSRIVLNPQNFVSDASEVEQNCDPTLPLGLGYYAFDKAIAIPRILSFWSLGPGPETVVASDLTRIAAADWTAETGTCTSVEEPALVVALADGGSAHAGAASSTVPLDPRTPILRICVRDVVGQWSLHIADGADGSTQLQPGSAISGLHYVDLRDFLGEVPSGDRRLTLGVVGEGARVVVEEMLFVPALEAERFGMSDYETDWSPAGLGVRARCAGVNVEGGETFVNRDSVVRELRLDAPLSREFAPTVVGRHIARPVWDARNRTAVMDVDGMCVAFSIPDGESIRFYSDESALVTDPQGSSEPVGSVGIWAVRLAPGKTTYRVGCGLDPADALHAVDLAERAAQAGERECRRHWTEYWDGLLARVPRPERFELQAVDDDGLDPAEVRAAYYYAFVGLYANVLPPQPETGYAYPTVATGKGSMWNHGAAGARSAAAWETFLAIQFLAYADGDLAWSCFTGLMSRVDGEGSLGGESLPSRKAQTAAILYALTGDRRALAACYPALKRLLAWQAARPRWIYGTYDFPGEQDAEFLSSLIIDLRFASQLAEVLGLPEDAAQFDHLRERLSRDYREHCFGPEREAVQHWFPGDETAALRGGPRGQALQVTSGLAVPGISGWQCDSLLARFEAQFNPGDQLAGFDFVKHPNVGHTVAGLIDHDRAKQAQILLNALLRDVIRSGSFAEVYDRGPDRPKPWGVRPSIFGMTQVIDAVWLNNGLRMDLGAPQPVRMPGVDGGVHGIRMRGSLVSISVRDDPPLLGS